MRAGKPIVGVAGGIGSGKSTVAAMLGELGAAVIDSDRLNHEELNQPDVLDCLRRWWGDEVIGPRGRADRDAIRKRVAADPEARKRLEQLVHPRIARRRQAEMARLQTDPNVRAFVWDVPLLYEAGLADQCDAVIFVDADRAVRRQRVLRTRGWTDDDLERFERAQVPLATKAGRADYKVVNNTGLDDLRRQVREVFTQILASR